MYSPVLVSILIISPILTKSGTDISKPFSREQIQEKLELVFKDSNSNRVIETDTPTYNPNVDRFKDNPAYVFDGKNDE